MLMFARNHGKETFVRTIHLSKVVRGKLAKSRFFQDETQNVNNSLSWVWASLVSDDLGTHLEKAYILFKMVDARLWILEELVKYWSLPF